MPHPSPASTSSGVRSIPVIGTIVATVLAVMILAALSPSKPGSSQLTTAVSSEAAPVSLANNAAGLDGAPNETSTDGNAQPIDGASTGRELPIVEPTQVEQLATAPSMSIDDQDVNDQGATADPPPVDDRDAARATDIGENTTTDAVVPDPLPTLAPAVLPTATTSPTSTPGESVASPTAEVASQSVGKAEIDITATDNDSNSADDPDPASSQTSPTQSAATDDDATDDDTTTEQLQADSDARLALVDPTAEATPLATATPMATATPIPTATPAPAATATPEPTPTRAPEPTATPEPTPTPDPTPTAATQSSADMEQYVLGQLNQVRANAGLAPFELNEAISAVSRNWSAQMASAGGISHRPAAQLSELMPAGWRAWGENVASAPDIFWAQSGLEDSPGHYKNMVDPRYTHVGIGVVTSGNAVWVTQNFVGFSN